VAKILAVLSGGVAPGPVCRGMYVLVTEMEIYMEFGIEVPVGWYLMSIPELWLASDSLRERLIHQVSLE
jgi:hypothetical protein